MAARLNSAVKARENPFLSHQMSFRRSKERIKTKKVQRKIRLNSIHIIFYFLLLGGIFYSFQHIYLFLISWDYLNIKEVEVICNKPQLKKEIQYILDGKKLGNILLLDINSLQETLAMHRWIKEVRIRKIFPLSLKIEIEETTPLGVLKKEKLYLIDKEGVLLEEIESNEDQKLPLLVDSNSFKKDYSEKLTLGWECLESLTPLEKALIDVLDLSGYRNVRVTLKDSPVWLILGNERFSEKIRSFLMSRMNLAKYGPLEYVDLRFQDRLIVKPQERLASIDIPRTEKEEN